MIIFFDLDGTLCDTPTGIDHEDANALLAQCKPRPRVLQRIQQLAALGHRLGIVTQRGHQVRLTTYQQLWSWLGELTDDLHVHHRTRLIFDWTFYVPDKEAALRKEHAEIYVGDRLEDKAAALRAGAVFLWAHEFEAHGLASLREVAA